jgi:hypothetical protein
MGDASIESPATPPAPSLSWVLNEMDARGYVVFDDPRGYDLNLVGVRSLGDLDADTFNDWLCVFYLALGGQWCFFAFPATTDPGRHYRHNPIHDDGTLVMLPGQYRGAYRLGTHKGYPAFEQVGAIDFARDADRDGSIDMRSKRVTGVFGANIHRAGVNDVATKVGRWSAGCQVVADPPQFEFAVALGRRGVGIYGNRLTYTVLER